MSGALDLTMIREEVAATLSRVAAHAAAGAVHVQAGTDAMLAAELRCCAASIMSAATLIQHLRPSRKQQGERAA